MISDKLIENECLALRKSIKKKERFVKDAPEGNLQCHKVDNYYNWYISKTCQIPTNECSESEETKSKKESKYIHKSERALAEKMALKGLYAQDLLDEKQELRALEHYLKHRSHFERREKYLSRSDELRNLLQKHLDGKCEPEVQAWLDTLPDSNDYMPEGRTHRCKNGLMVRSKSEQTIANALLDHNVPFKYESTMVLDEKICRPDFTVLNLRTGQEYRWEHFGMMGNPEYSRDNTYKIGSYLRNGHIPFVNFITTFEVDNSGVDSIWIERIIETFLK